MLEFLKYLLYFLYDYALDILANIIAIGIAIGIAYLVSYLNKRFKIKYLEYKDKCEKLEKENASLQSVIKHLDKEYADLDSKYKNSTKFCMFLQYQKIVDYDAELYRLCQENNIDSELCFRLHPGEYRYMGEKLSTEFKVYLSQQDNIKV